MRRVTRREKFVTFNPVISIHTLHAESDRCASGWLWCNAHFNPHSPCGEWRYYAQSTPDTLRFQSTLSMRRVTDSLEQLKFNLRISIHTLHAESDPSWAMTTYPRFLFQSTLSMRRVTFSNKCAVHFRTFQSTLSMRRVTERSETKAQVAINFNPHSPCGEWQNGTIESIQSMIISIHTLHAESDCKSISTAVRTK